jgi:hypothetical protein
VLELAYLVENAEDMNANIALTKPQHKFIFSDKPFTAMVGGLGSGKSQAGIYRILFMMFNNRGANCGYFMPSF